MTAAQELGIASATDLFGGVVPDAFMKTKVVTHELVDIEAERPAGWSPTFAARIHDVVLPGHAVFGALAQGLERNGLAHMAAAEEGERAGGVPQQTSRLTHKQRQRKASEHVGQ
jgi:uncharacterized protein DUF3182